MKNKFSSLCIISALLLTSTNVDAAYYYYRSQPDYIVETVSTCRSCNTCSTCYYSCPCAAKHHSRAVTKHHPKYYYASPHHTQRSHYSISTYYVYSTPCGSALWVPSSSDCNGGCGRVSVQDYNRAFYGPYYPASYGDYSDFDMDTRTGDDVYSEY